MKKIVYYLPFLILFTFFSCDDEPIDGAILSGINNGGNNNGGNNSGGSGDGNSEPSTGDYWPMAIGNSWNFDVTTDNQPDSNYTMEIEDYVTYSGQQQYLYSQFMGEVTATDGSQFDNLELNVYTRKNGGDYIITQSDMTFDFSGIQFVQTGYSYVILKDYLEAGDTWSTNYSTTTSVTTDGVVIPDQITNTTANFEIINRDFNLTVNGLEYGPIIHVKMNTSSEGSGQTVTSEFDYFFALDVGLVKVMSTTNDVNDNIVSSSTQELISYSLN